MLHTCHKHHGSEHDHGFCENGFFPDHDILPSKWQHVLTDVPFHTVFGLHAWECIK